MSIEPFSLVVVLTIGLALGVLAAWLVARVGQFRLRAELERDRAVQSERLRAYEDVGAKFRETFQALSAEALTANNRAFLDLAEIRLRDARTQAAADIELRKKAVENLLAPMAKTLEQVDREIKDSERRRIENGAQLLQRIASLDTTGQDLRGANRPAGRRTQSGLASAAAGASCS